MQMMCNTHDIQNKVITYDKKTKTQRLWHILEIIEIMIIFKDEMQNVTKVLHF
jgi:hypothetical protein